MSEGATDAAQRRRRKYRRQEWIEQVKLAQLLAKYLDPSCTFWTSLENKPSSRLNGVLQKKRGMRSGLPDTMVIFRQRPHFLEIKSKAGIASKAQKKVRAELVAAGAMWWLVRSARAALMALRLSGVAFRRAWKPPELRAWEGPFDDPNKRLPQAPDVAAHRREVTRRWRERQRALKTAATARDDAAQQREAREHGRTAEQHRPDGKRPIAQKRRRTMRGLKR
jgi:hypothetical protein